MTDKSSEESLHRRSQNKTNTQSDSQPTIEEMERARAAATPPPALSEEEAGKRSRHALLTTIFVVWSVWLLHMIAENQFHLFIKNWFMSATMLFGSFIAGSTSEGGGAVAFPVMTLVFKIDPACARNFSLAIQSVGMTAASVAILYCRISVERHSLLFSSIGGAMGVILGTFFIVPFFSVPAFTKMFFVSFWLAFAGALYLINRNRKREIFYEIVDFKVGRAGLVLITAGILGGIVTSITGSGLDIVTFSLLTLRYRVSEKVATPTSVVLMAINSIVGFLVHLFLVNTPVDGTAYWLGDFQVEARNYWLVCIPIVVIGAPSGAMFIRERSREFVAGLLYACLIIQMIGAIYVLRPSGWLLGFSVSVFLSGLVFFALLARSGRKRIDLKMPLFQNMVNGRWKAPDRQL